MAPTPERSVLTRRGFLGVAAGLAGAGLLSACGGGGTTTSASTTSPSAGTGGAGGSGGRYALAGRFDPNTFAVAGAEQRLVFSLLGTDGAPPRSVPDRLEFRVSRDGAAVGPPITVDAHGDGVPVPYYPLRFTPPSPGTYTVAATIDGSTVSQPFQASASSPVPAVGQPLPVLDSPTAADPRGVDPLCTRAAGTCPFHDTNLRDALGTGRPTVLLVSTPAYCQIGICGPVLDLLTELAPKVPGAVIVHAEVYKTPKTSLDELAPIVEGLHLDYEPALFVVDATGTIVDRLDTVFDRTEIAAALDRVA